VVSNTPPADISLEQLQQAPASNQAPTVISPRFPRRAGSEWLSVLQGGTTAPARARHEVSGQLNGELTAMRKHDVVLLVGELVANCVVHANAHDADEIVMELVIAPDFVRVAVTDRGSSSVPTVRAPSVNLESGRGLALVELLSDRWGITRDGAQLTRVWFEMQRED
jgi:anti-sigma regulatory factor (Ser/Thr protein kinase)